MTRRNHSVVCFPIPTICEVIHVIASRGPGDIEGSGGRQHRCVRVRQPRPAQHRHPDRQLHPAARARPAGRTSTSSATTSCTRSTSTTAATARPTSATSSASRPICRTPPRSCTTAGPIESLNSTNWNSRQVYTVTRLQNGTASVLGSGLACPPCNIGPLSTPNYAGLASTAVHSLPGGIQVFAGQRAEGFYVDLGSIFDLANLRPFENLHAQYGLNVFSGPRAGRQRDRRAERALHRHPGADLTAHPVRGGRRVQPGVGDRRVDHRKPPECPAVGRRQRRERQQRPVTARCPGWATRWSTRS